MQVTRDRKANSMKLFQKFLQDQTGATQIEYAIIGTLISVAIISGVGAVGKGVQNLFDYAAAKGVPPLK